MSTPSAVPQPTDLRGMALLEHPLLNKGTAFSREERRALGLEALLPWRVETIEEQVARCWSALEALPDDTARYSWLQGLRERNLTLFHRLLSEHVEQLMPVVYTPTVGLAIQQFSRTYRTPSYGVYLAADAALAGSADAAQQLEERLRQAIEGFRPGEPGWRPQLLLVTDAEGILGIGDQGVGGIHICLGKLAVYTLCAGLDPGATLPLLLDVGSDREELRRDPLYPGLDAPRLRGAAYDAVLDAVVTAVQRVCPEALVQWEDFGADNARRVLDRQRHRLPSFNDDIQGTSGVACAAVLAGLQGLGRRLRNTPVLIFGAGTAGCGIAERLLRLLQAEGLGEAEALERLWLIDRHGLVHAGRTNLRPMVRPYAAGAERLAPWPDLAATASEAGPGLLAVIEAIRPGVLIGTSTVAGAFNQEVIETLCRGCERPIVLPLSNPTRLAEVTPADLLAWSQGRALVATGSPFDPVMVGDRERQIGQCNNCFVFPGLGFASVAVGAREVSEAMIDASLTALAAAIPAAADPEAPLMPPLAQVQEVSRRVAEAVALAAVREGLATRAGSEAEALQRLEECRWQPIYPRLEPGCCRS